MIVDAAWNNDTLENELRVFARNFANGPKLYKRHGSKATQARTYTLCSAIVIIDFISFAKGYRKIRAFADRKCLARYETP
jgi:hypothetical protein